MKREGTRLLRIGEVARLSGLAVGTILNYEQQRLLQPMARSEAGHRLYGQEEVARVEFILQAIRVVPLSGYLSPGSEDLDVSDLTRGYGSRCITACRATRNRSLRAHPPRKPSTCCLLNSSQMSAPGIPDKNEHGCADDCC
jgi:hypothetical protein